MGIPLIAQNGFNRSFCGKNATKYGKGTYFARDASYSAYPIYARPDERGVQHMFLCKVLVGESCNGKYDGVQPDNASKEREFFTTPQWTMFATQSYGLHITTDKPTRSTKSFSKWGLALSTLDDH